MDTTTHTYRQTENDSRLQYMRSAPVSPGTSDQLMAVEKWLWEAPCLPAKLLVGNEFSGITPVILDKLSHVQQCSEAVVHLRYVAKQNHANADQLATIENAANVYTHELQRLLGSIFHLEDPFWEQFYVRQNTLFDFKKPSSFTPAETTSPTISPQYIKEYYGPFFITLDALHHLTHMHHSVAYQLLLQSLKWVLAGYYHHLPSEEIERKNALQNATQLVESLDLPDYKAWLIGMNS